MSAPFSAAAPLCWAHRGHSAAFPENTLPAFEAAVAAGADGVELDVTLSADGRLVVIHDATLDRTTDGHGPVSALPWGELAGLDAGAWFGPQFAGVRLPLLEEVLEAVGRRVLVNIEIKPEAACVPAWAPGVEPVEHQVAALVRRMGLLRRVVVSSFNYQILITLRSLDAELPLGVLCEGEANVDFLALLGAIGAASFHPWLDALDANLAGRVRAAGYGLFPWVYAAANTPEGMARALGLGATGFFANDPALFLAARAAQATGAAPGGRGR